jgi:hypothetical protein
VLDELLQKLKSQGHRVLVYSQMTKMIDLLEEFMYYRKHTYMRLDGSSKISERRDMVADFQNREDIFVFLLSTRAGGLGINLTAADTVNSTAYNFTKIINKFAARLFSTTPIGTRQWTNRPWTGRTDSVRPSRLRFTDSFARGLLKRGSSLEPEKRARCVGFICKSNFFLYICVFFSRFNEW